MDRKPRTYLSTTEAAEQLQVHRVTIVDWIKQGKLKAYQFGPRCYRIRRVDFEEFIAARSTEENQ